MKRKITIVALLFLCFHSLEARSYASQQLQSIAWMIKCPLPDRSGVFHCPKISSLPLVIEYDTAGVVCHLGFSLFADSLKNYTLTKPLYDFQERLFLEVFLQDDETKARKLLQEYEVRWSDHSQLGGGAFFNSLESSLFFASQASEFVMTKDSLTWTSSWQGENNSFIVRFPANFDLISGMDKKEAEIWWAKQLQTFQCGELSVRPIIGDFGELQQLNQSNYLLQGKAFFTPAMNSNIYFQVLYDRNFPEESIANLFNYPDRQRAKDIDLQVKQTAYGGESLSYKIKLFDFQCFMGDDYDVFTGIEKCTDEVVAFTVIYKSKWYNYNHLLHVQTTPQNLFDKTAPLEVLFYTFIPNHNIKNLYKEYVEKE